MEERWFKHAVIYSLDVETFQDSNADGVGDIPGLIARLDYLARLGVTCIWLHPIHPTPDRDDGYDVADYYGVNPRIGTLGDFVELLQRAKNRGIRVMIDLVVNHTSDEHPWFQSSRSSPDSPHRDWYVWSEARPAHLTEGVVFPGVQEQTWTWDDQARAWYHHRFYDFQPDLNWANRDVRLEMAKIIGFWLQLGVSGFRLDAAPFIVEDPRPDRTDSPREYRLFDTLRDHISWRQGDVVVLAEANVDRGEIPEIFGDGHRLHMLFNFALNERIFLALARQSAAPIREALNWMPDIADSCGWATFLRLHDEVDLSRLSPGERLECFAAFGPEPEMQLYDRGIRRRLAPMLGGNRRRIELAYALQFSLPGTPVLRYGEEIGMGDDLRLPERYSIRTPMQWSERPNAGFSSAPKDQLIRPVISGGAFGYERINVDAERDDDESLLAWFERMLRALRECPEPGDGKWTLLDSGAAHVLALRFDAPSGTTVAISNLRDEPCTVDLSADIGTPDEVVEMFANRRYDTRPKDVSSLDLDGWGFRWLRLGW
ncbi:MAG: maltose alpha-D-glucosyltransferase / alpha-amylase [Actinomycetota bacterium]|nr:maltose alpha-D-glucosyltransferase / alpha-amylase [Actinomycetota bacterium]